jgi:hypothetical protein
MSYHIRVLCQAGGNLTRTEIINFIIEGAYFASPLFIPGPSSGEITNAIWDSLEIIYDQSKRPIIISRLVNSEAANETAELLRQIYALPISKSAALLITRQLQASCMVISIELDPVGISEGAWLMIDCLESYLARKFIGIIYAPDDGYYNADLKKYI